MAVDLEKVAGLLDEAREKIEALETEVSTVKGENANLKKEAALNKEAQAQMEAWDDVANMGSVSQSTPSELMGGEGRLDDFLGG